MTKTTGLVGFFVLIEATLWLSFLAAHRRYGVSVLAIVLGCLVLAGIGVTASRSGGERVVIVSLLVSGVLTLIVGDFALFYWEAGKASNWGEALSKLDAVYVALGTLTTAGTGEIVARTQEARGLITASCIALHHPACTAKRCG